MAAIAAVVAPGATYAASAYWDADGLNAVGGGPGYWDAVLARWSLVSGGSSYSPFSAGDTAVFGGSGGVVHLTAPMTASLDIQSNGYVFLSQNNFNQLIFNSPTATVNVATGVSAELNGMGTLAAGSTLVKTGGGTFFLNYALSSPASNGGALPANAVDIQAGTLALARHALYRAGGYNSGAASINTNTILGINTAVNIGAAGVLNLGKFNEAVGTLSGTGTVVLGSATDQRAVWNAPVMSYGSTLRIGQSSTFAGNIVSDGAYDPLNARFSGGRVVIGQNIGTLAVNVTLSGTNSFHGGTWVSLGGGLYVSGGNAVPDDGPVVLSATTASGALGGLLQLEADERIGSLATRESGAAYVNPNGHTLTIAGNLDNDFAILAGGDIGGGSLGIGADQGGLIVKEGASNQFFSTVGATTFTGKYVIKSGRLSFNLDAGTGVAANPTPDYFKLDGGTLGMHGNVTTSANKGITVTANGGGLYTQLLSSSALWAIQSPVTGSGTLTRTGSGSIAFQGGDNSGFTGAWELKDGFTSIGGGFGTLITALGSKVAGTGSIDLTGAVLEMNTDNVGSLSDQSYTVASASGSKLSFGPGAVVSLNKNGSQSLTVTVGGGSGTTFERKTGGSMLLGAASGALNLGTAAGEKLLVNGTVNAVSVNGGADTLVPGVIATTYASTALTSAPAAGVTEGYFTTYDATNGLKVASMSTKTDINLANNTDLFAATADATLTADRSVYGIKIGAGGVGANLSTGGNRLNVGGAIASDPATVIIGTASAVSGGGTVEFGAHEGVIYTEVGALNLDTTVSGTAGLTKMGYGALGLAPTAVLNYTGKTTIEQGVLQVASGSNNQLPTSTDLVFAGTAHDASSRPTLAVNGGTVTVNSINSDNRGGAFGASAFEAGPAINLGANGVLKISGSGTSVFDGQIRGGTGASSIVVDGGGTLQLGLGARANVKDAGTPAAYQKLKVTNGSTVIVEVAHSGSGSSLTQLPSNGATTVNDAVTLDGGTLRIVGEFGNTSGASAGAAGLYNSLTSGDTNTVPEKINLAFQASRGWTLGAGGGTIDVQGAYNLVSLAGTSATASANGAFTAPAEGATLTKMGAGILQMMGTTNSAPTIVTGTVRLNIREGMVALIDDTSLGVAATTLDPAAITLNGGILGSNVDNALATTSISLNRGISVGSFGGTITGNRGAMVINGPLSGSGPLRLAQINVGNAMTFSSSSDGSVAGTPGPFTGNVTIASGYLVWANASNALGTGQITNDPAYQVQFGTNVGTQITLSNAFNIVKGNGTSTNGKFDFLVNSASGTLTLTGKISGNGDLCKGLNYVRAQANSGALLQSAGVLELANAGNDFTGDFTVINGTLIPTADGALSTTSAKVVMIGGNLGFKGNLDYTQAKPVMVGGGGIRNIADTNSFAGPITLMNSATLSSLAGQLTLSGSIVGAADSVLAKSGAGAIVLSGANSYGGTTTLNAGTLVLVGMAKSPVLTGGGANILSGRLVLDYADDATVPAQVLAALDAGFDQDPKFNTGQLRTSNPADPTKGLGWVDNASVSQVTVAYTYYGDTNLDGQVDITDLGNLATAWQTSGVWAQGDTDYSGFIDITDLGALATNWQAGVGSPLGPSFSEALATVGLGGASVPEPASLAMLALAGLFSRRRRH